MSKSTFFDTGAFEGDELGAAGELSSSRVRFADEEEEWRGGERSWP